MREQKEHKTCRYCGRPVIAPHKFDYHMACATLKAFGRAFGEPAPP